MNNPEYVKIGEKKYKINTDFRVALECDKIARDKTIKEYEKSLAIIYLLFGDEGLNDFDNHVKLLELGQKYLLAGKEPKDTDKKPDMDFNKDYDYIWTSFMSDYNGMDIDKINMHWWKFSKLVDGLSVSEFGQCCILNRIRQIRNTDPSKIKDNKERQELIDLQEELSLDKVELTKEQEESMEKLNKILGL